MKQLLLAIAILTIVSCEKIESSDTELKTNNQITTYIHSDGCWYVVFEGYHNSGGITHSGACPNHHQYEIDSAEIAVGYLRSNGAFKD